MPHSPSLEKYLISRVVGHDGSAVVNLILVDNKSQDIVKGDMLGRWETTLIINIPVHSSLFSINNWKYKKNTSADSMVFHIIQMNSGAPASPDMSDKNQILAGNIRLHSVPSAVKVI